MVSSYAIDNGDQVLLFDPLAAPREIVELAVDRRPAIVLTCPWHERDTQSLAERLSAVVFVPPPDEGSPDVAWLLASDTVEFYLFSAGDRLPLGIEAFPGREPNDVVLWFEKGRAVIAGDTLVDFGHGLEIPPEWLPNGVTPKQVAEGLLPLSSGRSSMSSPRTVGLAIGPPSSVRSPEPVRGYRYSVVAGAIIVLPGSQPLATRPSCNSPRARPGALASSRFTSWWNVPTPISTREGRSVAGDPHVEWPGL